MTSRRPAPQRRTDPTLPEGVQPSDSGLLGPLEVRAIAEALGIRPTKVLDQNFVTDAGTVRRIVRAGGVENDDEVVEVGPGRPASAATKADAAFTISSTRRSLRFSRTRRVFSA